MSNEMTITRRQAIKQVLDQLDGPIPVNEFTDRVLAIWPSKAKNPAAGIRQTLRQEHAGRTLIFPTDQTIVPIHIAMQGVQFRIPLSRQEVKHGVLSVYPNLSCFLPHQISAEIVQLLDVTGQPISTRVTTLKQTQQTAFGPHTVEMPVFDVGQWFEKNNVKRDDSLIVAVADWEARRFRVAHEPARIRKQRRAEIERRNQELADLLFEMLDTARYEEIRDYEAVLTAHTRLSDPTDYPGDHWLEVIEKDSRMRWSGSSIRYADSFSLIEQIVSEPDAPQIKKTPVSPEQARQVYRFKAALKYRKGLWRRIEVQGKHTLADLDYELRGAFQHDTSDHLSGFWKLVRRGQTRRFREVDLGNINPFGGGEAAELTIAGLELKPGDQMKYVYDFGDWIEHRITLEAIDEPQQGVGYPRLTDQNKPRYRYCRHCKAEGRKTVATWICIECSDMEQEAVLVCEDCLDTHHPEHYADEILY